ncbi:alanine transaminase [Marinobacterium stanieri]|uniref:Alanine-synthesizing transaminase n=1 Tax=Marinobacterium stanieri TaxID=49186 RepID=A0A1N6ULN6_9GAMM|nr:alanine transaminase [Marinobacterium stanieri]SIQ66545.1 alanine-synthesizing transaminase [Marinobacterium stanieri]
MTDKTGVQSVRHFSRIDRLPPYVFNITAELKMAARRRGEDIIDFSMGNPDGATPPHIVEKLCAVAQRDDTHGYSTSRGIPRLRRAISSWYEKRYEVEIDPEDEAIVTIGSKEGLAHLMLATLDHGDTVLVPNPSYPIHIYGAVIAGAQVRSVPLVPGVDFFVELERAIRESIPKPKMIILGFPSNPTAQCVELDFFERVVALAKQHDIIVVHDLAYADIVYDGWTAPSIMQVPGAKDVAVEFFTLSKSYNMAGWRIGFMVGNKELVHALARIKSYHDYGTFTPLQVAAIAALEGDQQCVRDIAEQYRQRRNVLVKGLHEAGWMVDNPKASMYVWAKIPDEYADMGSLEFSKKLLADAKVCVSPGIGFGDYGDDYVRFALIENKDRIRQAVRGIKGMFRKDGLLEASAKG